MLTDTFNRRLDYLRVSVTDKCNLAVCVLHAAGRGRVPAARRVLGLGVRPSHRYFRRLGVRRSGLREVSRSFARLHGDSGTGETNPRKWICALQPTAFCWTSDRGSPEVRCTQAQYKLDTMSAERYGRLRGDEFDRVIGILSKPSRARFFDLKSTWASRGVAR